MPARWQRLALLFAIAPFWSSYVLRLYAWQTILSRNGVINSVLKQIGLSDYRIDIIYTQIATRIGLIHYLAPILIVILYVSILAIDKVLIEAARELGCTRWQAFTRVILPLSRFGLMTAAALPSSYRSEMRSPATCLAAGRAHRSSASCRPMPR